MAISLEREFIDFLRVYKHDFLNHLQVVLGYLQLKKPEEALKYLKEAIKSVESHGSIMRLKMATISYWLLLKELEQREQGITMDLACSTEFSVSLAEEKLILTYFKSLLGEIIEKMAKLPYEARRWEINFTGQDTLKVIFTLPPADWKNIFNDTIYLLDDFKVTASESNGENFVYRLELSTK